MTEFNWIVALTGGILIGLSATVLLAFTGRIAGISGIVNGAIRFKQPVPWRWFFILGMLLGGLFYKTVLFPELAMSSSLTPWPMLLGGLLVGFGTRMGNGCTSGHGVCGLGRLSFRSLIAVITFMATAIITVWITHHLLGL
ncbi:putative transporter component [Xenococcus sp. PCC 7305]|uniref:YeeE/YedE family protein n=1 Tax=Xenococcus sp. PCC 7305 TaxID=102125 RepID=UPI0002ABCB9A|nr:YeeE/YedE thiosulfate transporter family protein [Xenococcus sp. PCC 7305]ELS01269.1 putative transporter component [Xenococcus sp. PCC 7305]